MTLSSIALRLNEIFDSENIEPFGKLIKGQELFRDKQQVMDLLESFLYDGTAVENAAKDSYTHSNGFEKIVLLKSKKPNFKLRLHIWQPVQGKAFLESDNDLHNHRWDFGTTLLMGSYRFEQYEFHKKGRFFREYSYYPLSTENNFRLIETGQTTLLKTFDCTMSAGTAYCLDADVIHRVTANPNLITASLVLQSEPKRSLTQVLSEESDEYSRVITWEPVPLSARKINAHVSAIQKALSMSLR